MKSEHRHELKTNDLAEWLTNLPQWAKKNRRVIIYVSIVLAVVVGYYLWYNYNKNIVSVRKNTEFTKLLTQLPMNKMQILQAQAQGIDASYLLIKPADDLKAIAQNANDDQMRALALIKRAETLRAELHYRLGTMDQQDLTNQINLAKASYAAVIQKTSISSLLIAKAKFGIGLCEEELGNFELAEQLYQSVATDASLVGTTAAAAARHRIIAMADYQKKVVFRQAPKPEQPEFTQPEIKLEVPDSNMGG